MREVVKKEVIKLLDAGIIYPVPHSEWVSPVHDRGDGCLQSTWLRHGWGDGWRGHIPLKNRIVRCFPTQKDSHIAQHFIRQYIHKNKAARSRIVTFCVEMWILVLCWNKPASGACRFLLPAPPPALSAPAAVFTTQHKSPRQWWRLGGRPSNGGVSQRKSR
jgi:hypothetical protein